MNKKQAVPAIILALSFLQIGLADRVLDQTELQALFGKLASTPRTTWIDSGTIRAKHSEYRAPKIEDANQVQSAIQEEVLKYRTTVDESRQNSVMRKHNLDALPFNTRYRLTNESAMVSDVLVKYDGERFVWEIDALSRYDSVDMPVDLLGNPMVRRFDMAWNKRRVSAWNGLEYTILSDGTNVAIVDATGSIPKGIEGPLTAGVLPWGNGLLSPADLKAAESYGVERLDGLEPQWDVTITFANGMEARMILLPKKGFAPSYWKMTKVSGPYTTAQCSGHTQIGTQWVPTSIAIEEYAQTTGRLLRSDAWEISEIEATDFTPADFEVSLAPDTLVEYYTEVTSHPLRYRTSPTVDTAALRAERLVLAATQALEPRNCAMVSIDYVASKLGVAVDEKQCASLLAADDTCTSLLQLKQCAMDIGLCARAVHADVQALKALEDYQVILHFPNKKHFVVLDTVCDGKVWIVDMAGKRFYYNVETSFLPMDWSDGTALLVSNKPIYLPDSVTELDDVAAAQYVGGEDGYSCTDVLQISYVVTCKYSGVCIDEFEYYYERCGCEGGTGSCTMTALPYLQTADCKENTYNPGTCTTKWPWTQYYMPSCEGYCTEGME